MTTHSPHTPPQRRHENPHDHPPGQGAAGYQDKVKILAGISSPPPVPHDGDEGPESPPGRTFEKAKDIWVRKAFQGTSSKRSPGPDSIAPLAIHSLFPSWDTSRVVAIIRAHIRLGVHPDCWKLARGVIIPKDYYTHCEALRSFHPGQYGCRPKQSAVDAVGVTTAQVQDA